MSFNINFKLSGSGDTSFSFNIESKPLTDKDNVASALTEPLSDPALVTELVGGVESSPAKVGEDVGSLESVLSTLDWQRLQQLVDDDRSKEPSLADTDRISVDETRSHCFKFPSPVPATNWFEAEVDSFLRDNFIPSLG